MCGGGSRYGALGMGMRVTHAAQSWRLLFWAVVSGWRGQDRGSEGGRNMLTGVALVSSFCRCVCLVLRVDELTQCA